MVEKLGEAFRGLMVGQSENTSGLLKAERGRTARWRGHQLATTVAEREEGPCGNNHKYSLVRPGFVLTWEAQWLKHSQLVLWMVKKTN